MAGRAWVRWRDRLRGLIWQARGAVRGDDVERELDEEHRFHIDMEAERLVGEGVEAGEARRRALVAFGGVERWQDEVRESRWTWRLEELVRDGRHAIRWLVRQPLFAAVAVGTLGVAVGAATSLFSVVDAVLLRPLAAVPDAGSLVEVVPETATGRAVRVVSLPDYLDYRGEGSSAIALAAHHVSDVSLSADGGAQAALGFDVSGNYFEVLGVRPVLGRFFAGAAVDDVLAPAEVVVSHAFWRSRFGGDRDVIGSTLLVNGQPLTIVGVAPPGFHGTMLGARPAVWLPMGQYQRLQGRDIADRTGREWLQLFGRLTAGTSRERAEAVLGGIASRLAEAYEYHEQVEPALVRVEGYSALPGSQRQAVSRFAVLLLAAAAVLLMIASVNIAGMLVARAARRGHEIGVRLALGAGRARLTRQLLVEGTILGLLGGILGVALAAAGTRFIAGVHPPQAPGFSLPVGLNGGVLMFALAAVFVSSLLFGLFPAFYATRRDLTLAMRRGAGARSSTLGRGVLLGGQVAMTLVLLVVTTLLIRTLRNAVAVDHGFDPEGIVIAELNLRLNGYGEGRGREFYRSLLDRLDASPDVASAAISTTIPLGPGWDQTRASVPGVESPEPSGWPVGWAAVSERYFETIGLPLLAGGPPDPDRLPPRLVVNRTMAERFWGETSPVGLPLRFFGQDAAVAGVAPTGRYRSLDEEATMFAWIPFSLAYSPSAYVIARPRAGIAAALAELRRAVRELDPNVPLVAVGTLDYTMGQSVFLQRTAARLIGAFAFVALVLSAAGIFGLLAFLVEQRRQEISVRMAMGASASRVVRGVVAAGLRPVAIGMALGFVGAFAATRVLEGLLFDVGARDPVSFGTALLLLGSAAVLAAWLPARRATGVHPAEALRAE